ncbi:YfzA family protein [Bacillus paranthracis]|uniref:YfzA family protein n=1 Tax=Bacillus paranthracis TaxID=2026186 RepID=UPI003558FF67
MKLKKERPSRIRNWLKTIGAFFVMQLIFIILDMNSWIPNFKEGGVGDRLVNSEFFKEWFAPYKTKQFNVLTAVMAILLFLNVVTSAIKDAFSRKRIN